MKILIKDSPSSSKNLQSLFSKLIFSIVFSISYHHQTHPSSLFFCFHFISSRPDSCPLIRLTASVFRGVFVSISWYHETQNILFVCLLSSEYSNTQTPVHSVGYGRRQLHFLWTIELELFCLFIRKLFIFWSEIMDQDSDSVSIFNYYPDDVAIGIVSKTEKSYD